MGQKILEEFKKKTGITENLLISLPDEFDEDCPCLEIIENKPNGRVWEIELYKTSGRIKRYYEVGE